MKQGFTLIEVLVVILIIGLLFAMALPHYGKAAERVRMTEAVEMLDSITHAQRRKQMQVSTYMTDFRTLDVSPKGATGQVFYTRGNPVTGANCNGFEIELAPNGNLNQVEAIRVASNGSLEYEYGLRREYLHDNTTCMGLNEAGKALCADFCGIDTPSAECCSNGASGACNG